MPPKRRVIQDKFFRKAKAEGYVARSAYKLLEIQERYHIIRRGRRVLDLGCAPGSWLQVASMLTARSGLVVGIDLSPVTCPPMDNVIAVEGDIFKVEALDLRSIGFEPPKGAKGEAAQPPLFDVVISDMAPGTTGTPAGDHFRSVALCRRMIDLLPDLLVPGGHATMKVFEGESYPDLLRDMSMLFEFVRGLRPEATREVSREMFIVAKRYSGGTLPPPPPGLARKAPKPAPGWSSEGSA